MCLLYIFLTCQGIIGPIAGYHIKPGGDDHIHVLCDTRVAFQCAVSLLACHLMESQPDLFIHGNACVYRRLKGTLRRYLFPGFQPAVLNIADIAVLRAHPGPLFHGFQHIHGLSLLKFCQDWAFHPALFPYLPCFLDYRGIVRLPQGVNEHALNLACGKGLGPYVRVIDHKAQRQIHAVIRHLKKRAFFPLCILIRVNNGLRKGIDQKLLALVPVKTLVQIFIHPFHRQIYLSILVNTLFFLQFII